MSEPVSNAEIEDVLSSIRRLVSENVGAGHRAPEPAQGRLVLTSAFRIDEDEESVELDVVEVPEEPAGEVVHLGRAPAATGAPAEPDADSLESRIAELEAAVDSSAEDWEPDGTEAESLPEELVFHHAEEAHADAPAAETAEAQDWEDADETDRAANRFAGTETIEAEEQPADGEDGEMVIDEAALREMVARMVREELQGVVGERITHNVRRMVRREIARALSLKGLD